MDIPTGSLEQLEKHLSTLVEKNNQQAKLLFEEYHGELTAETVALAKHDLFIEFVCELGLLTPEQVLQFKILHARNVKEGLQNAIAQSVEQRTQREQMQRQAALGVGPGKVLLGPGGVPIRR